MYKKELLMAYCPWSLHDDFSRIYHDTEWCRPHNDDSYLFEMLVLEGAQAGLSWATVLKKRNAYRDAFFHFDIKKCAAMTDEQIEDCLENPGLIRNRKKIESVRKNAAAVLAIQKEYGSFSAYLWSFTKNRPVINHWKRPEDVPCESDFSCKVSRDLKKRGCTFAGPVIIYSFLQAAGLIDDHLITCPFHSENRK